MNLLWGTGDLVGNRNEVVIPLEESPAMEQFNRFRSSGDGDQMWLLLVARSACLVVAKKCNGRP